MSVSDKNTNDLDELQREAERTRAELVHTVDELRDRVSDTANEIRHRVSPEAIKGEVKDYVRSAGERVYHEIERKARDNPLSAIAIGAACAYPIVRILGSMPVPLLLIGAGVALSARSGSSSAGSSGPGIAARARGYAGEYMERAGDAAEGYVDRASAYAGQYAQRAGRYVDEAGHYVDEAGRYVEAARDTVRDGIRHGAETAQSLAGEAAARASEMAESMRSRVTSGVGQVASSVSGAAETVRDAAASAAGAVTDAAASSYRTGVDTITHMGDRAFEMGRSTQRTVLETIERSPLLVAGVGLAIGAVIAAALPVTETENELMGDASSTLKKRVSDVAEDTYQAGVAAAGEVYEDVSRRVKEDGISAETVRSAVRDATDKAREVTERATSAVGGSSS